MSYAEDETDVEGTVNGVTVSTTGNRKNCIVPICSSIHFVYVSDLLRLGFGKRDSLVDAVLISVQVGAAVVSGLRRGKAFMTRRMEN